jgi:hypothetical protein
LESSYAHAVYLSSPGLQNYIGGNVSEYNSILAGPFENGDDADAFAFEYNMTH